MQHANFLVEIHTEELPPKSLLALAENFYNGIILRLQKTGLDYKASKFFATPRRLAVIVNDLSSQQADKSIERKGPAIDRAYDSTGKPTSALLGFARSCGVDVSELIQLAGNFIGCKQEVKGKATTSLMPQIIEEALAELPIPKPMRWGNHQHKFIRPVHSIVMLYGNQIIDAEILGCKVSNKTRGHRFLSPDWIVINSPEEYESKLLNAFVIADFTKRKEKITDQITQLKTKLNGIIHKNESLLNEVTSLVEWPNAICGSFDSRFLDVPLEALTAAMQDHQRYFPVFSTANKLLPHFITVSNITCDDAKRIISGNERVLRARLSDAAFFYETDKKISLEARIEKLKTIIFQTKLGTLFDKTKRVEKLAEYIAKKINVDTKLATRAALLSKTDLTTDLVGEFPELQGIAGYYYALHGHETNDVAIALKHQYKPRFSGDDLSDNLVACTLALADRLDTIVGIFGINQAPTGDKDPFGLRRAALGVLRIIIEKQLNLDLNEILTFAKDNYIELQNKNVVVDALQFILERLKPWYQEQGLSTNIIASVMTLNLTQPYDIHCRLQAVMEFKNLPEAESLSNANKRVSNILAKLDQEILAGDIKDNLFENDSERVLSESVKTQELSMHKSNNALSPAEQYTKILSELANLRIPIDNFFDHVMVMTDDKERRDNRLLLLKKLRGLFLHVADIALLQ